MCWLHYTVTLKSRGRHALINNLIIEVQAPKQNETVEDLVYFGWIYDKLNPIENGELKLVTVPGEDLEAPEGFKFIYFYRD